MSGDGCEVCRGPKAGSHICDKCIRRQLEASDVIKEQQTTNPFTNEPVLRKADIEYVRSRRGRMEKQDECRGPTIQERALHVAAVALCDWSNRDAPAGHLRPSIMSIAQAGVVIDALLGAGFDFSLQSEVPNI